MTVHNVFGCKTLTLQSFGFNARLTDGQRMGGSTTTQLDDGAPFSADGPVTCLTLIGARRLGRRDDRRLERPDGHRPRRVVARDRQRRGRERSSRHHDLPRDRNPGTDTGFLCHCTCLQAPVRNRRGQHQGGWSRPALVSFRVVRGRFRGRQRSLVGRWCRQRSLVGRWCWSGALVRWWERCRHQPWIVDSRHHPPSVPRVVSPQSSARPCKRIGFVGQ